MRRLTFKRKDNSVAQRDSASLNDLVVSLYKYEDIGLEPEEIKRRLGVYSSLLEEITQGKLIDTRYSLDDILDCYEEKSGEWIMIKDDNGRLRNKCSVCGAQLGVNERKTNFCPECGARLISER